jgi:hypothetical protein
MASMNTSAMPCLAASLPARALVEGVDVAGADVLADA